MQALRKLLTDWAVPSEYDHLWELFVYGFDAEAGPHGLLYLDEQGYRQHWCQFVICGSYCELIFTGRSSNRPPFAVVERLSKRFPTIRFALEAHTDAHSYHRATFHAGLSHDTDHCQCDKPATPEYRNTTWLLADGKMLMPPQIVPAVDSQKAVLENENIVVPAKGEKAANIES
jgi:hypothetical protein